MEKIILWCLLATFMISCEGKSKVSGATDLIERTEKNAYAGFGPGESRAYHEIIRDSNHIWLNGNGNLARYAFLHMSEFENHSILRKKGQTTPIPEAPSSEVGNFLTNTRLGKIPLKEIKQAEKL